MKNSNIYLCVVDHEYAELLTDDLLDHFSIKQHPVLYSEKISVLLPPTLGIMFEIGDDRLKNISYEILRGFCQHEKVVCSEKILVLNHAEVIRQADFCFSSNKRKSKVTGESSDLRVLLSRLLQSVSHVTEKLT